MKVGFNHIEKFIIAIICLIIALGCMKDEIAEVITTDDQNHLSITGSGARDGRVLPQLYMGSLTIWDANTKTQVILDRSSLSLFEFAKIRDKKPEMMGIPHTGEMYTATQWRVIIHWKSGKTFYSGLYSMKDTSVNRFTLTSFRGQSIGASYIEIKQTESFRNYYDYLYNRNKRTYLYQIKTDTSTTEMNLQAWHHPASSIFFLDHKN
jgi:hypothetical protein